MNYTLNDINCFIETEKHKDVLPKEYFQSIAVNSFLRHNNRGPYGNF